MKNLFVILFAVVSFSFAQNSSTVNEARPEIGWDAFKNLITYPEIARRAGVEDVSRIVLDIDSLGNVTSIDFTGYGIFSPAVKAAIKKTKWIPETVNGKRRASQILFNVQFQLKGLSNNPQRRVLTIEADAPKN